MGLWTLVVVMVGLVGCTGAVGLGIEVGRGSGAKQTDGVYVQRQDHFDPVNNATFQQQLTVDAEYYGGSGSPVFVFLGGEAPLGVFEFQEAFIRESLVPQFGALYVALEHRYFGKSIPVESLTTDNLRYLTIAQALEDAATVIQAVREEFVGSGPTVVFGCSYSANLAAWFKLKYPELAIGAVAASPPLEAKLNFTEFYGWFEHAAVQFDGCSGRIREGVAEVSEMMKTESGRAQLAVTFNLCNSLAADGRDDYRFKHTIMNKVGISPQWESPPGFQLTHTCAIMTNESYSPVEALAEAVEYSQNFDPEEGLARGERCNEWSQDAYIGALRITTLDVPTIGRAWMWLKCTTFGYFQTSYPGTSVFFDDLGLQPLLDDCAAIYDIPGMVPDVEGTNAKYEGNQLDAKNVLITNGYYDPWHTLSIYNKKKASVQTSVYQAAHCAPFDAAFDSDPWSLRHTRQVIANTIEGWLA